MEQPRALLQGGGGGHASNPRGTSATQGNSESRGQSPARRAFGRRIGRPTAGSRFARTQRGARTARSAGSAQGRTREAPLLRRVDRRRGGPCPRHLPIHGRQRLGLRALLASLVPAGQLAFVVAKTKIEILLGLPFAFLARSVE